MYFVPIIAFYECSLFLNLVFCYLKKKQSLLPNELETSVWGKVL